MKPRSNHALIPMATAVAAFVTALGPVHAQEPECTVTEEAGAKERYQQAESFKSSSEYFNASAEYRAAFELCPRPFLVFNAAQMLWLDGKKLEALDLYEQYLELDSASSAATTAVERFFLAAEEQREHGVPRDALILYERYLRLAPGGDNAKYARARMNELRQREVERLAEQERTLAEQAAKQPRVPAIVASDGLSTAPPPDWRPGGLFIGGSALLFFGVAMHSASSNNSDDDGRSQKRVAIVSYAIGGTAFSLGLIWLLRTRTGSATPSAPGLKSPASHLEFTPMAGPHVFGGSWRLHF
jgi:tetratricopeptide (TPR) repeat protein